MAKRGNKLEVRKLALSIGIVAAISMFLLGFSAGIFGFGNEWVALIGTLYKGYNPSLVGSLLGAVYGFIDGAIGGALIAWIYNKV
jgi:hypothetical protein